MELLEILEEGEMENKRAQRAAADSKRQKETGTPEPQKGSVFRSSSLMRSKSAPKRMEKGMRRLQTWDGGPGGGALKDFTFALHSLKTGEFYLMGVAKTQEKLTWQKAVHTTQEVAAARRAQVFRSAPLAKPWNAFTKLVSVAQFNDPVSQKETILVATDQGVYLGRPALDGTITNFEFIIQLQRTLKVRMKKEVDCMFVLAGTPPRVYAIPFSALQSSKKPIPLRQEYKINHTSGTSHFLVGSKNGRTFLCCIRIKSTLTSSRRIVVILELQPDPKKFGFSCQVLKEFELKDEPSSIRLDLFPNAVCTIGHSKILFVDFSSGGTKEIVAKGLPQGVVVASPRNIFRLASQELLICSLECAVFVNSYYESSREVVIKWLGVPVSFGKLSSNQERTSTS